MERKAPLIFNVILTFLFILFSDLGMLPFGNAGMAATFFAVSFGFFLWRPEWGFAIFCGSVVLETINLLPESAGISVRPYQLFGVALLLAVMIRYFLKQSNLNLPRPNWIDGAAVLFFAAGFLSALGAYDKSLALKQAIIASSFAVPYALARVFVSSWDDLKKMVPSFFGASAVVVVYGIWQNAMFQRGWVNFEVMPGRPNATFSEPDWLGVFLVFVLAMFFSAMVEIKKKKNVFLNVISWIFLMLALVLLIITVARSAWLGAFAVTSLFLAFSLVGFRSEKCSFNWKEFFGFIFFISSVAIAGFVVILAFNLTRFELQNRAVSTSSGLQGITIACQNEDAPVPGIIGSVDELEEFGCRHINLEEVETLKQEGMFVKKIQRNDPNVGIRARIYEKSLKEIKAHPILGIGWGNISDILGRDERGAGLNSSNILLEIWLGAGILGVVSFLAIAGGIFWKGIQWLRKGNFALGMVYVLGIVAILIPNMFNAGIMLGFVWLFLGMNGIKK